MTELETDYLIVGSGAMGMAFADTGILLALSETKADMVIVDRHAKPGGHWNVAYPFVRLHHNRLRQVVNIFWRRIARIEPI